MNTVIHSAVRRDIGRFGDALEAFPVGSRQRAVQLDAAWRHLDGQLYHHHHGEETIFWPALCDLGADESLVGDLGGEHERMAEAMSWTRAAMSTLAVEPSEEHVDDAKAAFAALREVIETHFAHEERDLEPMMARAVDTPQFKRAQSEIRKTQSLPAAGAYLAWLLDEADPDARAFVSHEIPRPVLFVVSRLFGRSYNRVAAAAWQ
jgi:iron-sulfur cluster repair protein YtfE (RIC family)